ncbi:hypothetical protein Nepgr_013656 [Nepenthes gracilis]|uniref:Uncharacterized protein n=1 Tax=Nepenthes gracilis TaxID=150966 RepID=A0AAD3SJ78_NEPGR|nr:hypothetical protein Nepgr_013656 [Nepenthes gracilis]
MFKSYFLVSLTWISVLTFQIGLILIIIEKHQENWKREKCTRDSERECCGFSERDSRLENPSTSLNLLFAKRMRNFESNSYVLYSFHRLKLRKPMPL